MRTLTAEETAAMFHFHDRYAAQRGGAIEFWKSLDKQEQRFIRDMVDAILDAQQRRSKAEGRA